MLTCEIVRMAVRIAVAVAAHNIIQSSGVVGCMIRTKNLLPICHLNSSRLHIMLVACIDSVTPGTVPRVPGTTCTLKNLVTFAVSSRRCLHTGY